MKLLYPLYILISFMFPRKKKLWVFGCYDGYVDNTSYFFEYSSSLNSYECVWLANNEIDLNKVRDAGNFGVSKNSLMGYWLASRAEMTFICTGFSDVHRILALKSKVINFWHGTPIKKVYFDSVHDLNRFGNNKISVFISRMLMKVLVHQLDFYYASNEMEREIVVNASGISFLKSKSLGSPRFDKIRNPKKNHFLEDLKNKGQKIILYAPTWREEGKWSSSFLLNSEDIKYLNDTLKCQDTVLIIKPHPLTNRKEIVEWGLVSSDRILYTTDLNLNDINEIYKFVDLLITDVSSSMFDFLIFNKPVLLFMPDLHEYILGKRGIYNYFENILKSYSITSWDVLINEIKNTRENKIPLLSKIAQDTNLMTNTNQKIYEDILARLY